ncbi:hypothetical protein [Vibrio diazotrophicus]|uniref:hypothetical protein n=1 Tax=Vibrio diazotrophicus TaxID=685 RepID=UPI00142E4518|nr:hypothetical protein [Vibrio diazotrophicus]NIY91150.1 hypothetical protein [Vibrio diazotrophicus]
MSFIDMLLEEIDSEPCSKLCTVCHGQQSVRSFSWSQFILEYGAESLDYNSKFRIAERAWIEADMPDFENFEIAFLDLGLSVNEAKDFYEMCLVQNSFEVCHNCQNGRELTDHGKRVANLRDRLINL